MVFRFRAGAALSLIGAASVWSVLSACLSSPSTDGEVPQTREVATDPGCKVMGEGPAKTSGRALATVHLALSDGDAGMDASSDADTDAGPDAASDSGADAAPPSEDGGADATDDDAGLSASITAENVRSVACRQGTTLDVAAGGDGGLFVSGAGIRAQVVTFSDGKSKARVVDYLRTQGASARIATLADGRPLLFGMPTEKNELTIEEGESGPRPVGSQSAIGTLGRAAVNAGGAIVLSTAGDAALVRSASGEVTTKTLSSLSSSGSEPVTTTVGIGNDDRLFRVSTGGPPSVVLEDRTVPIATAGSVRGAAFTTLAADINLPALALVVGASSAFDLNAFEVAIPSGDAYARVEIVPSPTPCATDAQCSNTCTEQNTEVEPTEIALAWDGTRAFVAFVRRTVTRERRYVRKQGSGFVCDLVGCDPYCTATSSGRTTAADLVIATIDVANRAVREVYALPLEVQLNTTDPATLPSSSPSEVRAYARDGYLHVAFTGKYQGSFDAVSVYRFRTAP